MRSDRWQDGSLRPREKLLQHGAQSLSDQELLALVLGTGTKDKNVMRLSHDLLQQFDGLRGLLDADAEDLKDTYGLGPARYTILRGALEISKRYLDQQLKKADIFNDPESVNRYLNLQMHHETREIFGCLYLDTCNKMILFEKICFGTLNKAMVYPREIIKRALECQAVNMILVHNHPSGNCKPSAADRSVTENLQKICNYFEMKVLDHLIIGQGNYFSFANAGML